MSEKSNRIAELEALIREHNERYYDMDSPVIDDPEYDNLKIELEKLCPESPVLNEVGNPTFGDKHEHSVVMGSLSKCHSALEIMQKFSGLEIILMPKIDGCSMATMFSDGWMILAATRGDGHTGEVVTPNASVITNMPYKIENTDLLEFRGEAYISKSDFYGTMDQPGYGGKPNGMANPRNAAAGSLRQKDASMTKERKIRFVAYEIMGSEDNHSNKLDVLKNFGFEVPPYRVIICSSEDVVQEAIDELKEMDASLPYETDGIVVRINDQKLFENLGYSGKCPKGALAYKFESVKAKSKVLDIEWTTSRTGRICPVAIIEPTRISGSLVSRITLNNLAWIENIDVAIGDEILFEKANEIIPRLVAVLKRTEERNINLPLVCSSCSHPARRPKASDGSQGIDVCCVNDSCPAQFHASVLHILEKLDIKGVAENIVGKIIGFGLVKSAYEIFDVTEAQLREIGFGDRQAEIICQALKAPEASKAHILSCLGIDGWGRRMFETLSKQISLDDIAANAVSVERLASTPGVGLIRAKALVDGLTAKEDFLNGLMKRIAVKKEAPRGTSLAGKTFLVTGTLSVKRQEIEKMITDAGGDVISGVSKKLNYLIVGEDAGSKLDKAIKLGITTITEEQFRAMLP